MGSNVISGSAKGIIVSVGNDTLFGHVAETLSEKPIQSSFELGIHKTFHATDQIYVIDGSSSYRHQWAYKRGLARSFSFWTICSSWSNT